MLYGFAPPSSAPSRPTRQVRVLISYGSAWFAWYMRRLPKRPANIWFVLRNVV